MTDAEQIIESMKQYPEYMFVQEKGDYGVACIIKLAFTYAILAEMHMDGYEERWCYKDFASVKNAFDAWDGTTEPTGWHRHPKTGRRIDEHGNLTINF